MDKEAAHIMDQQLDKTPDLQQWTGIAWTMRDENRDEQGRDEQFDGLTDNLFTICLRACPWVTAQCHKAAKPGRPCSFAGRLRICDARRQAPGAHTPIRRT